MKIKIFGFELESSQGYTLEEFFSYAAAKKTLEDPDHILAVQKQGKFWVGLFVTIRDQKSFCRFRRNKEHFSLTPESLGNDRIADFNHFVFDSATSRGLYQWYHQSAGVGPFCSFLRPFYAAQRNSKKDRILEGLTSDDEKKCEAKRFGMGLNHIILCRRGTFESRVRSLEHIRNIEYCFATYAPAQNDPLAPLSRFVKAKKETVSFEKRLGLVTAVANFVRSFSGKKMKVEGVDSDGIDQIYKLANDHDVFEEYDYDSIIENIKVDSNSLSESLAGSQIIERMLSLAIDKMSELISDPTET